MARYSFDDLPGPKRTRVRSKTYGEHTRAPRGSKSKAEVNDTLKKHNTLLIGANVPAMLVKRAIDSIRDGFPTGQLWQSLVGMFKMQLKVGVPLNVSPLMYKDLSIYYRQSRLVKQGYIHNISAGPEKIKVEIAKLNPTFRKKATDGYQVRVSALFFDFELMEYTAESAWSAIVPLSYSPVLSFELNKGYPGNQYLICISLAGCIRHEVLTENAARSMLIIQTGIVTAGGLEKSKLH